MSEFVKTYIRLNKETFESVMGRANQESIDSDPNDDECKNDLLFSNAEIRPDELHIEDKSDELVVNGGLWSFGKELGWIDITIPLDSEIAVGIIDRYMKKLGKLKTILEATKD